MIEFLIVVFVFSSIWIVWMRPLYYSIKLGQGKQWIEYWVVMGLLSFAEYHIYSQISRQIAYNFVKTMTMFVLCERAIAATRPPEKKKTAAEIPENPNLDSIAEQIYYLENLSENFPLKTIEKLLTINDPTPFQLEKKVTWIEIPKSIRAFTAYKLAVLVSSEKFSKEKLENFRDSSVLPSLIDMLKSNDIGDRDNSLLLISYLVENSKKLQKSFFHMHIFELLKKFLVYKGPASATAIRILRNIYKSRSQAKAEIMRMNLAVEFFKFLRSEEKNDVVEATHAINDLVMHDENVLNKGLLMILANQGLSGALQAATETHGTDNKLKIQLKCLETFIKSL